MADKESGQGRLMDAMGNAMEAGDERGRKAGKYVATRNQQAMQPLIRSQKESLKAGTPCWIYNASRIFSWTRSYKGMGEFLIQHAPRVNDTIIKDDKRVPATKEDVVGDFKLSAPISINRSYIASFDKGDSRRVPYVEYGDEIAESLLGCSELYPSDLREKTNNLLQWGVILTYDKPFYSLPKAEQDHLYTIAKTNERQRCFEMVQGADERYNLSPKTVLEVHRLCLLEIGEERPWASKRTAEVLGQVPCAFCEFPISATAAICKNCHNVIDEVKYEKQKAAAKARKAEKPDTTD